MKRSEQIEIPELSSRLSALVNVCRAIRVRRWCLEWPRGHAERPRPPGFVAEFERVHGPAPASAERVLARPIGAVVLLVVAAVLLVPLDAEGSSRPRREEREAAVSTLDAQESSSQANVVRLRQPLVGGCLGVAKESFPHR